MLGLGHTDQRVETCLQRLPGLTANIDVVAGTSTGVMLGGLLAMGTRACMLLPAPLIHAPSPIGYNAAQAQHIFNRGAVAIFRIPPWWREFNPFTSAYDGTWKEQ